MRCIGLWCPEEDVELSRIMFNYNYLFLIEIEKRSQKRS